MSQFAISLDDIYAAHSRISPFIRATPILHLNHCRPAGLAPQLAAKLLCKLENHQVTGSFKVRGALNKVLSLPEAVRKKGLVTASGGNHGMALTYAGRVIDAPVTVYLSKGVPEVRAARLRAWGATVVRVGVSWDDAHAAALKVAQEQGCSYVHAFADPVVIAGQGTLAIELHQQMPAINQLLIAVGGGGLIAGLALGMKALQPQCKIIGVEPKGAAKLTASFKAGHIVALPSVKTKAVSLAPKSTSEANWPIIQAMVDEVVCVTDEEMLAASRFLWDEGRIAAEMAGAAGLAALQTGQVQTEPSQTIATLICGGGADGVT